MPEQAYVFHVDIFDAMRVRNGMRYPASVVIEKFGGVRKLANALGHRHPSTVQGWLGRGHIPIRQAPAVLDAAQRAKIELTADDLVYPSREVAA